MSAESAGDLLDRAAAIAYARRCRAAGKRLVVTNGCFDLLHAGHVGYLTAARALGDALLVGLNSDASTRALKGPDRPLTPERDRAMVLLALRAVDAVVIFDELTANRLLADLRPEIYVKGGDYVPAGAEAGKPLPEEPTVRAYGGEIHLLPYLAGRSSTDLIKRIRGARTGG
ncbi:MAG: adenylyltransferase/cytidyltransferase family protein [Chloroflexota bacterium]